MNKEMVISSTSHETRVAILEDDQVVEIFIEREHSRGVVGNIYKGRVSKVLPGMQSAFVDLGLERDAFLYVSDVISPTEEALEDDEIGLAAASPEPLEAAAGNGDDLNGGEEAAVGASVASAEYPDKPIRMIVPFPPGGGTDIIGRIIADKLTASTGWTIMVENKAGAGGTVGMDAAAKAKPDGYTIVLGQTSNMSIAPFLMSALPYDPLKDFTPVTLVNESPLAITTGPNTPLKSMSDLIAAAKAQPGKLLFASPGNATVAHLTGELLQTTAGIKYTLSWCTR